jgi:predicted DsbA family dithiol-disulfide isomerase
MQEPVTLDLWSDVVCPWCWVGKRRLEAALADEAADAAARREPTPAVRVRLRAFELRPEMPLDGADAATFYRGLFGGEERYAQVVARMTAVGEEVGIRFDYPAIRRTANTRLAHRLIAIADDHLGQGAEAMEALHAAYFEQGLDVGDLETILRAQADAGVGLDIDEARDRLLAGEGLARVEADEQLARQLGVTGVPMFVIGLGDGTQPVGVSGAQPPEVLRQLLQVGRDRAATTSPV